MSEAARVLAEQICYDIGSRGCFDRGSVSALIDEAVGPLVAELEAACGCIEGLECDYPIDTAAQRAEIAAALTKWRNDAK